MTHVLIGTPVHDRRVDVEYTTSLLRLLAAKLPARFGVEFPRTSFLPFARNALATRVLTNTTYTHLLFIDSDMGFSPSLIGKMLAFDQPVVGCIYPARKLDHNEVVRVARARPDLDGEAVRDLAIGYIGELGGERRGEFVRSSAVGTGILLIRREVLEQMRDTYPDLWLADTAWIRGFDTELTGVFQCFSQLEVNGAHLGEDYSFCHRWTRCGGEIWACVTEEISHSGPTRFSGNVAKKIGL